MADEHVVPVEIAATETKITYTVKELLARIDTRMEHIEALADSAAQRAEVTAIAQRVDKLEREAEGTKQVAAALLSSDTGRLSRNEKVAGLLFAAIALTPAIETILGLFP